MRDLYDLHAKLIGFLRAAVQTLRALEVCYFPELLEISRRPIQDPLTISVLLACATRSSRFCSFVDVPFLLLSIRLRLSILPTVLFVHMGIQLRPFSRDLPARAPRSPRHITYHLANPIPPLRLFVL